MLKSNCFPLYELFFLSLLLDSKIRMNESVIDNPLPVMFPFIQAHIKFNLFNTRYHVSC